MLHRALVLGLALVAIGGTARGQGNLAAPDSFGADYQSMLRTVLGDAFAPEVRVRALVEPSFQPEFAVGIRGKPDQPEIFVLQPASQIWGYALIGMMKKGQASVQVRDPATGKFEDVAGRIEAQLQPRQLAAKVGLCEISLDAKLAGQIVDDWRGMLDRVESARPISGLDGEFYYFSMEHDAKSLVGVTWSPPSTTSAGMLVSMTYAMRDYCRTRSPERLAELARTTRQLADVLRAEPAPP